MDQLYIILIRSQAEPQNMSEIVWKCFRCGLAFKAVDLAEMHERIARHHITRVKRIAA